MSDEQHLATKLRASAPLEVGVGDVVFDSETHFPVGYPNLPPQANGTTRRIVQRGVVIEKRGGRWYGLPIATVDVLPSPIQVAVRMLPWRI